MLRRETLRAAGTEVLKEEETLKAAGSELLRRKTLRAPGIEVLIEMLRGGSTLRVALTTS